MPLTTKVACVTGASRGLGEAILMRLATAGTTVVGTATTQMGAAKIQENLKKQGAEGMGVVLDVTDHAAVLEVLANIRDTYGACSILVNNAGITDDALLLRMQAAQWDRVIQTNLTAIFHLTKACLKDMVRAKCGRIIHISSVSGMCGSAGQVNYAAAKAGMVGFSKSLAREVASRNITVNTVAPGFIETDMTYALKASQKESILSQIPVGRMGKPEDIAAAVAFLASDDANYITGSTLHVNGGMYMV